MFVEKEWLSDRVAEGMSLERIARILGVHASTVGYWLKRHGLTAAGAGRFAARGPLEKPELEAMVAEGLTLRQMAEASGRSIATVRYWLRRHAIERAPVRRAERTPDDPRTAPRMSVMVCRRHGLTEFVLEGRGRYRCKRCRQEQVAEWRRRVKRKLVVDAGGRCLGCGYDRCLAALQFHHVDPGSKEFALSHRGLARSLEEVRREAAKCLLLCANCHAEVENGVREPPPLAAVAPRGGFEPPRTD